MRIRRIFRPTPAARLRAPLAIATAAGLFGLLISGAVPRDLLGAGGTSQVVSAVAADVRVLDGETLRVGQQVLRMHALKVPERGRAACRDAAGQALDCGVAAAAALAGLVGGRDVTCELRGVDGHGRPLGTCQAGGVDVNASLVAAGWARADSGAAPALGGIEAAARQGGRGLWQSPDAESWRRGL